MVFGIYNLYILGKKVDKHKCACAMGMLTLMI